MTASPNERYSTGNWQRTHDYDLAGERSQPASARSGGANARSGEIDRRAQAEAAPYGEKPTFRWIRARTQSVSRRTATSRRAKRGTEEGRNGLVGS